MHVAINAVLFQCVWFATILLGWEYALLPAFLMLVHAVRVNPKAVANIFIPSFILLGVIWDSVLIASGLFTVEGNPATVGVMPLWLINCWIGFSLSLGLSMAWWSTYPKIFIVACAGLAPVSYYAGMRFGVLSFELSVLPVLAAAWAIFAVLVVWGLPKMMAKKSDQANREWRSCEGQ